MPGHKGGQYVFKLAGTTQTAAHSSQEASSHTSTSQNIQTLRSNERATREKVPERPSGSRRKMIALIIAALVLATAGRIYWAMDTGPVEVPYMEVQTFHTTSSINENVWPADQRNVFEAGSRVYVFGNIWSEGDTRVTLLWVCLLYTSPSPRDA